MRREKDEKGWNSIKNPVKSKQNHEKRIKRSRKVWKAFMEEYGVIVVAAIVIMIIVVAASPIGDSIKSGIMEAVQKLTNALADANGVS